jgi:hypothetical protein
MVIDLGMIPRLLDLLRHPSVNVLIPTLRSLGYITSEEDYRVQIVINMGLLPALVPLQGDILVGYLGQD